MAVTLVKLTAMKPRFKLIQEICFSLFLLLVFSSCQKNSGYVEKRSAPPADNDIYKNEFTACNCAESPSKETATSEFIKAEINGVPECADVKGGFSNSFDNMFKYGLLKRTTGNTYYDNLYMIRNTRDGKFQMGIFMENTHLLTKQFPYQLPRANSEYCEIGEFQLINQQRITNNMCFTCNWSDWHYLGMFWGNDLVFTAERFENDYFEGRFEGNMRTGSGRIAKVTNGRFRIKLTRIPEDVIIP